MAQILDRLFEDMKKAMKAGERERVNTLRLLINAIKQEALDRDLNEDDEIAILQRALKQRRESIEEYQKAGRQDLVESETWELEIIKEYLPRPLNEEELRKIIEEAIQTTGASSLKDMGVVMKEVMPRVKGRADGQTVSRLVKEILS